MREVSLQLGNEEKTVALLRAATRRDGLNPRTFLDLLGHAIEEQTWEYLPEGKISFIEFLKRCGLTSDSVEKAMELPIENSSADEDARFAATRRAVRELLDAVPRAKRGQIGRGRVRSDNVRSKFGNEESHLRRKLREKRPDLYEKVLSGDESAYAMAIEAGIRRPTATIPIDTPENAVRALARRFDWSTLRKAFAAIASEEP